MCIRDSGGGAWWVSQGTLWYVDYADQRIRVIEPGQTARTLTAQPEQAKAWRYADFRPTTDGHWLIGIAEHHRDSAGEPENLIIAVATDGSERMVKLAQGSDFYGSACVSPDGNQLAWIQWQHPHMPWDDTELLLGSLTSSAQEIRVDQVQCVAGGVGESIVQPRWSPKGELHFVSDRRDLWHLYKLGVEEPVLAPDGEIGYPPWVHGLSRYDFLSDGSVVAARFKGGIDYLPGYPDATSFFSIRTSGDKVAFASATWSSEEAVYFDGHCVRPARELSLHEDFLKAPEVVSFATGSNGTAQAHALYYAPSHSDYSVNTDERPPLIVLAHGGPTAAARSKLQLALRFWTSRGFAVVDVNYRGSSGFGRGYRKQLEGQWGIADVEDCVAVARFLVDRGDVDAQRLIIRGGSAGGFTVLSALAFHDTFTAGASLYGVADLTALAEDTHKFESRYLDSLIGAWPAQAELYRERSPINHLPGFSAPMIVLQGADDAIVPPNQSRMIVDALDKRGLPVAYLEFAGEQHGFRQAATIIKALQSELSFYAQVFGFEPAGETIDVDIKNL